MNTLRHLLLSCCFQTRTTEITDNPTLPQADPTNPDSKKVSSTETAPKDTVFTPNDPSASATSAQVANNPSTSVSTSQTPMVSLTTEPSIDTPDAPVPITPALPMFKFSGGAAKPSPRSRDFPIPSIELTDTLPVGWQDEATTKSLQGPAPHFGTIDTPNDVNRNSPEHDTDIFCFGESREASPFTFHKMHNATPEPSQSTDHFADKSEAGVGLLDDSEIQQMAKTLASSNIKDASISMSDYLGVSNLMSGSSTTRKRVVHGRYNVKDERPPNEPYFTEQFQRALQNGKYIAGRIKGTLQACELAEDRESYVFEMIQTATELHNFDAPAVCTIGIMGDSGVGKARSCLRS
jgi:hypothetical protein